MDNKRENMEKINDMYTQVAIAATWAGAVKYWVIRVEGREDISLKSPFTPVSVQILGI